MTYLDNARIVAIYAVILLHTAADRVTSNTIGTEYWWTANIYDSIVRWCVPVLVMLSGALLLDPHKQESLSTFYKKRLSRIVIPLFSWSAFFLVWAKLQSPQLSASTLLDRLLSGAPYYHLWYLYMILGLYLFTPFFRIIVRHSSKQELLFLIIVSFLSAIINSVYWQFSANTGTTGLFINWFLLFIPYYLMGSYIRQDQNQPCSFFLWSIFCCSCLTTAVGCYILAVQINLAAAMYFYGYLSITVIPMSISLLYLLKTWDKAIFKPSFNKKLSLLTLGIYLIHPVILETLRNMHTMDNFHPIIAIPITASLVFTISFALIGLIDRIPFLRRVI